MLLLMSWHCCALPYRKSRGGGDGPRIPLAPRIAHCVPQELFLEPLSFCNHKEPFLRVQVAGVYVVE